MTNIGNSKLELEIERHCLNQTKKLSDGSYEKIFSRNPRNNFGIYTYNCLLCSVANLPGEIALRTHINGKKHQMKIHYDYIPDAKQFRAPLAIHPKIQPVSNPYPLGEPRPPGLEDDGGYSCYLDQFLTKCEKPLIGIEYVLELHDHKMREPLYICVLCDKRCDPRNIIPQMVSHRHRMKYLDTHFSTLMNILNRDRKFNIDMAHREEVLTKISKQLEERFGRFKPTIYEYRDYERNKEAIVDRVKALKHFNEKDWSGSEKDLLKGIEVDRIVLDEISSEESDNDGETLQKYCEKKKRNDERRNENRNIIERGTRYGDIRETSKPMSFSRMTPSTSVPTKLVPPRELAAQSEQKFKEAYTFEKFKTLLEIETKRIDAKYKDFEKNPERHPSYSDEWKAFWQRRYNELLAQGKDANGHNYKPEWVEFWMPRMRQLKLKEIDDKKKEIRKKLNITQDIARKYEQDIAKSLVASPKRQRSISSSPSPDRSRNRRKSRSPVVISDDSEDEYDHRRRRDDKKRARRDRSDSRSRPRYSESPMSYRSRSRDRNRRSESSEITDDAPVNIVTVCRLLTALESELGIIAPRVVKILEDALAMERNEPNSSEKMLLENSNINFLDTVKEKLKGLLSADLVGPSRMIPVKRAIKNIAALLHDAQKLKAKQPAKSPNTSGQQPDSVELAKLEIAKVLAQTLIDQGRTDVSPEELSEIVDEFMKQQMADQEKEKAEEERKKQEELQRLKASTSQPKREEKKEDESGLEHLTDDDLKTLLRNFSDLTEDEQKHLIKYLEKLEKTDPKRVKMLSKYVDAGDDEIEDEVEEPDVEMGYGGRRDSPKSSQNKISDDEYDDEQDTSRNQALPNYAQPPATLSNNQNVAAELFSSLMQSQQQQQSTPMQSWNWDMGAQSYYQQQPAFASMQPQSQASFDYSQQLVSMSSMQPMIQPTQFQPGPWVNQNNAPFEQMTFASRQPPPPRPGTSSGAQGGSNRKKDQRPNIHQLTGKGKNKNSQNRPN